MTETRTPLRYGPTARYAVRWQDVVYRDDGERQWLARVYEPQGNGPFPALVELHGGAWTLMDRTQNQDTDEVLAASGLVVVAPDFHLGGQAPHPAAQRDINYAIRWLKHHAAEFRAAPEHVGGLGFSSGGHQIMLAAMRPRHPEYAAIPLPEAPHLDASLAYVMMAWPVLDPLERWHHAATRDRQDQVEAGTLYFGDEAGMLEANPQQIAARREPGTSYPPALLVHGAADDIVPPRMAEQFAEAYAAAGGIVELAKYPGEKHRFMSTPGPNTSRALAAMQAFISRQLAAIAAGQ